MEKLVVTRHQGGSFESRPSQARALQPGHASQRKTSAWHGLDLPLERETKRPAPSTKTSNRHNPAVPHRSSSKQSGRPVTLSAQRKQTSVESEAHDVWGTHQPLSRSRTTALIEVGADWKQILHQELDRASLVWSSCGQHEDYADSRMAGQSRAPGWNQAEDQERSFNDLLARSPLGARGTQSGVRAGRHARSPRRIHRCPPEQQNFDHTRGASTRRGSPDSGATTASRGNDGARRCSNRSQGVGAGRAEMEERWVGDGNPSFRVCVGRRGIEGNQERELSSAPGAGGSRGTAPVARAHALSLERGLDLRQPALPRQNTIHLPNSLSPAHSPCDRTSFRTQEQQGSAHRLAYAAPFACHTAHFERGKCEGHAVTTATHHSEDNPRTLRAGGLCRSTESPQEGRQNGASAEIFREIESEKCASGKRVGLPISQRNRERLLIANFRGAWGCPVATRCNWRKRFEIMVSAAGFEPA